MTAELLVNVTPSETRVAYIDGGILQEIHIEREARRGIVGNIYKGRVSRVLPGMQAAFVDIGLDKAAFLHASVHAGERTDPGWDSRDADLLLRDLYDGSAVCRTIYLCGAQPPETGSILFASEEGDHRGAADDPSADARRARYGRRVPCGAGVKCDRRDRVFCDYARYSVACA